MDIVLHSRLPVAPWADPRLRRLPGILPLDPADWLEVDEAYDGQMALRDRLIAERREKVHGLLPRGRAAAEELYDRVLADLPGLGFRLEGNTAMRPDGLSVSLDRGQPLLTLGRLCQQDFCLMQPGGPGEDGPGENGPGEDGPGEDGPGEDGPGEHVLTGAILCFPAGWTLAEKLGRPMLRIHRPVARYTPDVGRRVQRLFDAIRVEQPLWRMNAHRSRAPLFNPMLEDRKVADDGAPMPYVRCERQCLLRLPRTGAVVFSIHTLVVRAEDLTPDQAAALEAHTIHRSP